MANESGFSLLELMVSAALTVIVSLAFLTTCTQFQDWASNLTQILERDDNLRMAPLLLSRFLLPSGNQKWTNDLTYFVAGTSQIELRSDIDGSDGFPDLQLASPFEDIALRVNAETMQLRSGKGSFQPLLKNIHSLESLYRRGDLLDLELVASTERPLKQAQKTDSETIQLSFYLPNFRPTLFPEVTD